MTGSRSKTLRIIEIAKLLGVTKQRAHQIAEEKGFPAPIAEDGRGRVWSRYEVQAWARQWRRGQALEVRWRLGGEPTAGTLRDRAVRLFFNPSVVYAREVTSDARE